MLLFWHMWSIYQNVPTKVPLSEKMTVQIFITKICWILQYIEVLVSLEMYAT